MSPERYEDLVQRVAPILKARKCRTREAISPAERITLTLCYLACGDSQQSMAFNFRMGRTTVCKIIQETCEVMWFALQQDFIIAPQSEQDWKAISSKFYEEWDFTNCLGALDGKHVAIECPGFSGSEYYNYKGFFSIVLMAICDAQYCFTIVDIGNFGRDNDAQIFTSSEMGKAFISDNMSVPSQTVVEGFILPHVLVSDEIFGLKTWLMKPYPGKDLNEEQRIFNYRLSRACGQGQKYRGVGGCDTPPTDKTREFAGQLNPFAGHKFLLTVAHSAYRCCHGACEAPGKIAKVQLW